MLIKTYRIVKNNLKKTIFFSGLAFLGADYFHTSYKIDSVMRTYCRKAEFYGKQNLNVNVNPKHLTVILNPVANKRRCRKYFDNYVAPILHCAGIQLNIIETESQGHAIKIMETIDNTDAILIAGGTGTIHESISGLLNRNDDYFKKVPIGILPLGYFNTTFKQLIQFKKFDFEKNAKRLKEVKILVESLMNILNEKISKASLIRIHIKEKNKSVFAFDNFEIGFISDLSTKYPKYWYLGDVLSKYYLLIKLSLFKDLSKFELEDKLKIMYTQTCSGCSKCYESLLSEETKQAKRRLNSWFSLFRSYSDKKNDYLKLETENKLKNIKNEECGVWKEKYLDKLFNIQIKNEIFRNENYLTIKTISNKNNLTKFSLFHYAQNFLNNNLNENLEKIKARDIKFSFDNLVNNGAIEFSETNETSANEINDNKETVEAKTNNSSNKQVDGFRIDGEIYELQKNVEINSLLNKIKIYG